MYRLADSPDISGRIAAVLQEPASIPFSARGRFASLEDFDIDAECPSLTTAAVNALLPTPQPYVLAGSAGPAEPVPPTALEAYAECPHAYFVRHLLRVGPVEQP